MNTYIKTIIKTSLFSSLFLLSFACQDVIDVPLESGPERLVVEASLDWEKGTPGNLQTIKLSKSTGFYQAGEVVPVTGASVVVTNEDSGATFDFEDQNNGAYSTTSFQPVLGESYSLEIIHQGAVYRAVETMVGVTDFDRVYQGREEGFDDELLELHIVFTDPEEVGNNYLFRIQRVGDLFPGLEFFEDEFVNGNQMDYWYELEDDEDSGIEPFQPGDVVEVEMFGVSRGYYDFIKQIISQFDISGPFISTPVGVRGNCINETDPENYAYGYFRLSQKVRTQYTFVED